MKESVLRHVWRATMVAVLCACIAGCVNANDPNAVAQGTSASFNQYTGLQNFAGPVSPLNGNILQGTFMVRGTRKGNASIADTFHQIYVTVSADGWLFLNSAWANGQALRFVAIDRSVSTCGSYGCIIDETVGVNFTYDELVRMASTGFSFQLRGQRGSRVVTIPASYFQGYLKQVRAAVPA